MRYVQLQNEKISSISLGTWSWGNGVNGGDAVFGNNLSAEDLKPVFDKAMSAGLNLWDTAAVYGMGASETILGNFIETNHHVLISTKFTPRGEQSENAMEEMLNQSLKRLGVDHTDIYWIHNPQNVNKWTSKLIPLMKSGKVKYAGVSNHNLEEIKLASSILAAEGLQLSAVQNHYSLLYRSSEEAGIIDWCNHVDPAQIAIAWSIAKGTVPIIGVTKPKHIDGAVSAVNINLSEKEIKELENAAKESGVEIKGAWEKSML